MREPIVLCKLEKCSVCKGSGWVQTIEYGFADVNECPSCHGKGEWLLMEDVLDGDKEYEEEYLEDE